MRSEFRSTFVTEYRDLKGPKVQQELTEQTERTVKTVLTVKMAPRALKAPKDLRVLIRTWKPQLAAVEKFFFYRSSTTISVVQARGVLMMTLARFGVPVVEFPPMQIKLALAGHGHADKDDVLDAVMRELNLDTPPRPDDAADALAVALTGWFQR